MPAWWTEGAQSRAAALGLAVPVGDRGSPALPFAPWVSLATGASGGGWGRRPRRPLLKRH